MNNELATSIIASLGCNPNKLSVKKAIIEEYGSLESVDLYDLNDTFEEVMGRLDDNQEEQDYLNKVQELFDEIDGEIQDIQ